MIIEERGHEEEEKFIESLTYQPLQACECGMKSPCLCFVAGSSRISPRLSRAPMIPTRSNEEQQAAEGKKEGLNNEKKR